METPEIKLPNFIADGTCKKDEQAICNIGYACDGCPYNSEIKNGNITKKPIIIHKVVCYCCEKKFEEKDITKIEVGKDKVTGAVEQRFVCKRCNHLPEYQKIPMEIIEEHKEIQEDENV